MKHITLLAATLLIGLAACRLFPGRDTLRVAPPIPAADVPFTEHTLSNDTDVVVHSPTGTRIHIPANSLEWADGSPVTGPVTLRFREFHDAWGILRAGIPMEVAGSDGQLRSAAMIDLRIGQDDRQARLRNNAGIDIQLATYQRAEGFDLYYLDGDSRWTVVDTFATRPNSRKADRLAQLDAATPDPGRYNPRSNRFLIEADTIEFPYMKPLHGLRWQVAPRNADAAFRRARRMAWEKVEATRLEGPGRRFRLRFTRYQSFPEGNARKTEYSVVATPVGRGRGNDGAELDRRLAQYDSAYADWRRDYGRTTGQADLLNEFRINRLGIWNLDILFKKDDFVMRDMKFDFEASKELASQRLIVYAVYESANSVLPFNRWETQPVAIPKEGRVSFFTVLNDTSFAYVSDATLRAALAKGGEILLPSERRRAEELPKLGGR